MEGKERGDWEGGRGEGGKATRKGEGEGGGGGGGGGGGEREERGAGREGRGAEREERGDGGPGGSELELCIPSSDNAMIFITCRAMIIALPSLPHLLDTSKMQG